MLPCKPPHRVQEVRRVDVAHQNSPPVVIPRPSLQCLVQPIQDVLSSVGSAVAYSDRYVQLWYAEKGFESEEFLARAKDTLSTFEHDFQRWSLDGPLLIRDAHGGNTPTLPRLRVDLLDCNAGRIGEVERLQGLRPSLILVKWLLVEVPDLMEKMRDPMDGVNN